MFEKEHVNIVYKFYVKINFEVANVCIVRYVGLRVR